MKPLLGNFFFKQFSCFLQVGYGDITPITVMGKLIGTVVVFLSMVFLALPLTIIVSTFSKV